jgi:hypothetical protein
VHYDLYVLVVLPKVVKARAEKCCHCCCNQGDQNIQKKIGQVLEKVAHTVDKPKIPKYIHEGSIDSPKHLLQILYETLK